MSVDVMNGAGDVTITINGAAVTVPGQKSLAKKGRTPDITSLSVNHCAVNFAGRTGAKTAADARTALGLGTTDVLIFHQSNSHHRRHLLIFILAKTSGTIPPGSSDRGDIEVGAGTGSLSFRINGGLRGGEPILAASIYTEVTVMRMRCGD
jgi:hypothetical protein